MTTPEPTTQTTHAPPPGAERDHVAIDVASQTAEALARQPLVNGLVSAAVIVTALYFGRDLLMPLALAVLVGFVLDPLVSWFKRRGLPRALAVCIVMFTTLALLAGSAFFIFGQLRQLGGNLPVYEQNITRKLRSFGDMMRQPGVLDQYSRVVTKVEREIDQAQRAATPPKPAAERPTRVEIVGQSVRPAERVGRWIDGFATPVVMVGIVIVFVFLILLDKGDLRDRALRLLDSNLHRTTDALDEAARRVSKYLGMQLIVNATYGIPMALGLLLIGVPGALVWGVLAAVLRFVPYVGPIIGAVFPVTLAFAVDPGWNMVLWTLALIVTLEVVSNNIIEPWLYGTSTGLSTLSLILAAMFWTAIWGPIGLILSTPITVVLLVLGHHLPQLRFLEVLLGSERALDEPTRLHQRLLAGDVEEAVDLAIQHADAESPRHFYDTVGLDALRLATNAHGTVATAEHRHRVISGMDQLIDEMRDQYPPPPGLPVRVACLGGRWAVDALAADMAAHTLALEGIGSRVVQVGLMSSDHFAQLDLQDVEVVVLCYFTPDPTTLARYFVRRLRRHWPDVRIILAAWNHHPHPPETDVMQAVGADALVTSLDELLAQAHARLTSAEEAPYAPAPLPDNEPDRLRALHGSGLLEPALRRRLDTLAKRAADAFDCSTAWVSLVDEQWQISQGDASMAVRPTPGAPAPTTARALSLCGHVIAQGATLVVPDASRDARFAANPALRERGVRFYAGAPLRTREGLTLGTLCLLDAHPRTLSPRDVMLLENMADEVMRTARQHRKERDARPEGAAPPLARGS
ncbi:MAG: AI-2E family transporter [Pseudomonadota bacterium]|nr:AI-2E family transporter [Pseudomonadota bacterium]